MKKLLSIILCLGLLFALAVPSSAAGDPAAVDFVTMQGYMVGTGSGFEPGRQVTKAMACRVLYNMAGQPQVNAAGGLRGADGQQYAPAAAWAVRTGLISSDGFDGSAVISGPELTSLLAAYALKNGRVLPNGAAFYGESVTRGELAQLLYSQSPWTGSFTESRVSVQNGGRKVEAVVTMPVGNGPFPAVVMNHGHGGSKDEGNGFAGISRALAAAGIASIRMDFPGCGESTAPFTENYLSNMVSDSNACRDYLVKNEKVDADHLGVLGYSMGGRITSTIISQGNHGYQAVVPLAGAVGDGKAMTEGSVGGAENYPAAYAEAVEKGYYTVTTQYGQTLTLSKNWFDDLRNINPLERVSTFTGPVLVMYGDEDTVVPPEVNALSLAAYPNTQEIVVPGANHGYAFYENVPEVTRIVEGGISAFFAESLISSYVEKEVSIAVKEQDGIPAHEVPGTLTLPAEASGAPAVVMLHGTGTSRNESGNAFARLAKSLAADGIASLRIDFMGCGASTANNADFCPSSAIIDAKASADYLASLKEVDGSAIGVVGWSQGGMDALLSAAAHPDTFKAVTTWAGAISMDGAGIFGDVSFAEAYETAKEKGEAIAPRWSGEPMHVGVRWFEEVQSMDTLAKIAKYPGPILAVHGVDDSTVPPESAEQIAKASPNSASRTHMVEDCEHTFNVFAEDTATMDGVIAVTGEYFLEHLG